jgi:hypothetical protein
MQKKLFATLMVTVCVFAVSLLVLPGELLAQGDPGWKPTAVMVGKNADGTPRPGMVVKGSFPSGANESYWKINQQMYVGSTAAPNGRVLANGSRYLDEGYNQVWVFYDSDDSSSGIAFDFSWDVVPNGGWKIFFGQ